MTKPSGPVADLSFSDAAADQGHYPDELSKANGIALLRRDFGTNAAVVGREELEKRAVVNTRDAQDSVPAPNAPSENAPAPKPAGEVQ